LVPPPPGECRQSIGVGSQSLPLWGRCPRRGRKRSLRKGFAPLFQQEWNIVRSVMAEARGAAWGDLFRRFAPPSPKGKAILNGPLAFPFGEGGLPRSGKTEEVLVDGLAPLFQQEWNIVRSVTKEARGVVPGDLFSLAFGQPASPEGKPFGCIPYLDS